MKKLLSALILLCGSAMVLSAASKMVGGSAAQIQAAVDSAPNGGTVTIANGTYNWNTGTVKVEHKSILIKGESKGGVKIISSGVCEDVFQLFEPDNGYVEMADINFDFSNGQNCYPVAIRVMPQVPRSNGRCLLHDCDFVTSYTYAVRWETNGGVIWNCFFDPSRSAMTGISFVCPTLNSDWTRVSTVGMLDSDGRSNTYIEDCIANHGPEGGPQGGWGNVDDNSRTVFRHNTFDNVAMGSHGQETAPEGVRQWEFYDNEFKCDPNNKYYMDCYLPLRGGTGVMCDNRMDDIPWGKTEIKLCVFSIRRRGQIPCQTEYPAARQVGQGWKGAGGYSYPSVPRNGTGYFLDPIYIWNNGNALFSLNEYEPDECGNNQHIQDYVKEGRDYIFGPKPGYQKYTYPHPMRMYAGNPGGGNGGGGGDKPTPTPQPTPTPTPQPTPTPNPTPNPTPTPPAGTTYNNWLNELSSWIAQHPAVPDSGQRDGGKAGSINQGTILSHQSIDSRFPDVR